MAAAAKLRQVAVGRELKGSRRELALVFADGTWRTANEAARAMGRPTGSIFGVLRRMHADGLLEADAETPTRGTQYRLTAAGHSVLASALAEEQPPGQVRADSWVLVVEAQGGASLTDFEAVVAQPAIAGDIVWSAALGWGWLLVLSGGRDPWPAQRLTAKLESRGFRCRYGTPTPLLSGAQLRARAATLTDGIELAT